MDAWSRAENEVVVAEYVAMLEQELAGQSYVKTEANGRVRALTGRSRGSVEFKFQNVSGVLIDMHAPWVEGYKPAKNYQASLAEAVEHHLSRHPEVMELMRQSIIRDAAKRIDVAWNVITPPAELAFPAARGVARPMHTDFVALEAANRSLGASGEVLILERERRRLAEAGRGDLAGKALRASGSHRRHVPAGARDLAGLAEARPRRLSGLPEDQADPALRLGDRASPGTTSVPNGVTSYRYPNGLIHTSRPGSGWLTRQNPAVFAR